MHLKLNPVFERTRSWPDSLYMVTHLRRSHVTAHHWYAEQGRLRLQVQADCRPTAQETSDVR